MAKFSFVEAHNSFNGIKRQKFGNTESERPQKRLKALLEEDDPSNAEGSASSDTGGVPVDNGQRNVQGHGFNVNQEFARRFEHNKKREEFQKCEVTLANYSFKSY